MPCQIGGKHTFFHENSHFKLFLEGILILLKYIKTKSELIYFLKQKTICCLVKQKGGTHQAKCLQQRGIYVTEFISKVHGDAQELDAYEVHHRNNRAASPGTFLKSWNELRTIDKSSHRRYSIKKLLLKICQYSLEKTCVVVSFLNLFHTFFSASTVDFEQVNGCWVFNESPKTYNLIKKRSQHRFFSVSIVKFLRKPILKNICKRLLLHRRVVIFVSATYGVDALKSIRYYHKIQPCFIMMSGKSAWTNKIHGQMCIMKIQNARMTSIFIQ